MKKILFTFFTLISLNLFAQTWSAVGIGIDSNVNALTIYNGNLYAAGSFHLAGGITVNSIAKWNGTTWSALGTGIKKFNNLYPGDINALAVYNGELYAAGWFDKAGGVSAFNIAKWNGTTWSAVGAGLSNSLYALTVYNGNLYAVGNPGNGIAKWDGAAWTTISPGVNNWVFALVPYNGELYVGGYFTLAGGNSANNIAKWNGTRWASLDSGVNQTYPGVSSMVVAGALYVGGSFTSASGHTANHIAKWNDTGWAAMGSGIVSPVTSIAIYNNEIYAGGAWLWYSIQSNSIVKWKDTSWVAVGTGVKKNNNSYGEVHAMITYNNALYVAGIFTKAGTDSAFNIAKWTSPVSAVREILNDRYSTSVYPNPANSELNISSNTQIEKVEIFNLTGMLLSSSNKNKINISDMGSGIYFVKVYSENGVATQKFIKQ